MSKNISLFEPSTSNAIEYILNCLHKHVNVAMATILNCRIFVFRNYGSDKNGLSIDHSNNMKRIFIQMKP